MESANQEAMTSGTGVSDENVLFASMMSADSFVDKAKSAVTVDDITIPRKTAKTDTIKPPLPTTTLSYITAVELQVFKTFVENYKTTRELRREDAIALDFMFGPTIQQVFEMIEEDRVTIRRSPVSGRVLVEVCGKSGDTYWIPPGHSLCQCMAYAHGKKEYCKHVLAAHLSLAITPKEDYDPMSDEDLSKIYKEYLEDSEGGDK